MSVRIVLQNAKTQLEAQKQKVYNDAYQAKYADLKTQLDDYTIEKKREYDEAVLTLKAAFDEAINAKKAEFENLASSYADVQVSVIDKSISDLQVMIDNAEGV